MCRRGSLKNNKNMVYSRFAGANGDREKYIFPVQVTTRKIGNHALLRVLAIHEYPCVYI